MGLIDRKEIFKLFLQAFKYNELKVVSGLNPCIIKYNGTRFNVYIKNLTPAQLSNKNADVWRCQLPKRPIFDDFKKSNDMFLLLGYDASNDVFATWNPYWAKQRLNIGESVSMYSRYSVQKEAKEKNTIIQYDLNHNGIVLVFPRMLLSQFLDNVVNYFAEETEYIAIGSSLRKNNETMTDNPEDIFSYFKSTDHISEFKSYLEPMQIQQSTRNKYVASMKYILENGLFSKHKDIFLKYNSLKGYNDAIKEFYESEDIAYEDRRNGGRHGYLRTSLKLYYKYLTKEPIETIDSTQVSPIPDGKNYPNICTTELKEKIAPLMCLDEPLEMEAMQILYNTFGDSYSELSLTDWLNLLRKTNWKSL